MADAASAVTDIPDGATVMIGGLGRAGQPVERIDALIACGASDLTIVNNNVGNGDTGLAALLAGACPQVRVLVRAPGRLPGLRRPVPCLSAAIELELEPQGNLAERIRAAGAGIGAFFSPTGASTELATSKEERVIDGRRYVLEHPIRPDFALISSGRHRLLADDNPARLQRQRQRLVAGHHPRCTRVRDLGDRRLGRSRDLQDPARESGRTELTYLKRIGSAS